MTISTSDLAFYETYAPQVAVFGISSIFDDRDDRNLFRKIEKFVNGDKKKR
jgi:hypothetical protein